MAASSPAPSASASTSATPSQVDSSRLTDGDKQLLASTTTHEKLLVSQAVFEKGTEDWEGVRALIEGHALIKARDKEWFESNKLAGIWAAQLHETGHEDSEQFPPQAPELRKIAHHYYMMRVHELYAGMEACQDQFRIIFSEIAELKEGKLDWRLTHPERAAPPSPVKALPAQLPPLAELPPSSAAQPQSQGDEKEKEQSTTMAPKVEEHDVEMQTEPVAAAA